MKLIALLFVPMTAFAQHQAPPGSIPGHDQIPPSVPSIPHHDGRGTSCAPEVVEGNVAATERVLNKVANSAEFASPQNFKNKLQMISKLRGTDEKIAQYFSLIDIDSKDSQAVESFVGARAIENNWIISLERSAGLTPQQAETIARELQIALRGDLQ